jgi:hypothetical protein
MVASRCQTVGSVGINTLDSVSSIMRDAAAKTRHAVQMAIASRALAAAATDAHRKRVVARYVFVYLDDVIKFAAPWRNRLHRNEATRAAADSALPALKRLRYDWKHYEDVRNYIGAKRQPRNPLDRAADELESFAIWLDIGELAVGALVDDAVELYAQLAAVDPLPPVEYDPQCSDGLAAALNALDTFGEEGSVEVAASSFGADRPGAFPIRQGGEVGRLVPLINDVAENIKTLQALRETSAGSVFDTLLRCQLPSELYELLRLALGPEPGALVPKSVNLLDLYGQPDSPDGPRKRLEGLRHMLAGRIDRAALRDWRNRIGVHIDEDSPWTEELSSGIEAMDLDPLSCVATDVFDWLEGCALEPGGPLPLLFPGRKLKSIMLESAEAEVRFDDPDASARAASIRSANPPAQFADSPYGVWISGSQHAGAAVAGMQQARARELNERINRRNAELKVAPIE